MVTTAIDLGKQTVSRRVWTLTTELLGSVQRHVKLIGVYEKMSLRVRCWIKWECHTGHRHHDEIKEGKRGDGTESGSCAVRPHEVGAHGRLLGII